MSFLNVARSVRFLGLPCTRNYVTTARNNSRPAYYRSLLFGTAISVGVLAWATPKVHLDSPVTQTPSTEGAGGNVIIDPATSIAFPETMRIPSSLNLPPLTLVGLGVRTVSFLGIKVYSVGFYADLENPKLKVPKDVPVEKKVDLIIENTSCVIRIVPTRSTNYTHLRDAFVRAMNARLSAAIKDQLITEDVAVAASSPIRKLKSLFPNSPLAKHTPLDIYLATPAPNRPRSLIFRDLGTLENDWVATEFVKNYFGSEAPSPALKQSVLDKLKEFSKD
ncbi:hypothetical protein CVT24_013319 [Panaeolus cyanescens]|uniref:Chalcone isomerase domain-containing protein n=1 Tax=Panaeolus cyanescens TaxID=181874 RepID=A0A409WAE2_9AGAR|nr:hypothetical protein CVT24_013319 [Panaeolus cyanescens]